MDAVHGGDIYSKEYRLDFSANINPLGMPEAVREAACRGVELSVHYPDVWCRELRDALGREFAVPADHIICGNGAAELIFALAQALRPRKALLVSPGFAEYELALRSVGCEIAFYECRPEKGFVLQEDYLQAVTEELDMVFLCNPANPTGVLLPRELPGRIADRCREKKVLMVLDECFNGFLDEPEKATLIPQVMEKGGLFILGAFTKLYAMAGLRLGYGICRDKVILEKMRSVLQPWNVSLPAQMAGRAALEQKEYVRQSRECVKTERSFLIRKLRELGMTCYASSANFVFFHGPAGLTEKCEKRGILIRDCSNYRTL